jgi:5-methyltetrahydropteroyltriglutamate--homocysteine methyltransferase
MFEQNGIHAFAPGIYPRSALLVQATRDVERGRTSEAAVQDVLDRDRAAFLEVQEQAGLDLLSDGMLDWQDVFRPLADHSDGLEARPLTRFLDTNTFFRASIVSGSPSLREAVPAPELAPGRWVGTIPSPYAFSVATGGTADAAQLARDVVGPQIVAWAGAGASLVVLDEPFVAREPDGLPALAAAVSELPRACPLALRLPFADAGPLLRDLLELPVDAIGVDFYATSPDALPQPFPKVLLAGVLDVRNSAVEDPSDIAAFAGRLAAKEPSGIALCPNGDLQFVSEPIAREKILRLGAAREAARG